MSDSFKAFRITNEPLSFHDRAYIAIAAELVRTGKVGNRREVSCDIQAAWDLAKAMAEWRDKMNKKQNENIE